MATTANRKPVQSSSAATGEKPSFLLFGGLALIGLLKDTLDLIGIGSLPVLGTGITLCFSFFSFMLLLLFDRSGSRGNKRLAQGMVVTFGTLIEGIGFVINFLPLQTLTVVFLYIISYRSWKSSQRSAAVVAKGQRKKLQTQQARMARAIALREERMNRQAANDTSSGPANTVQERPSRTPRLAADTRVRSVSTVAATPIKTSPIAEQPRSQSARSLARQTVTSRPSPSQKPQATPSRPTYSSVVNPVPSQRTRAANDPMYAQGGAPANEATLRIRAAAERLSKLRNSGQGNNSAAMRSGQAPSKQPLKRAA